ncbi:MULTISPECIES: DUF1501 domain-containing protein [unclassified Microbacterium]|uniref:DUF1501 domain-containing protein n=1 Tax=unclassified Microbacterium TaxID=2609290 RepID=UPI0021583538|nr:MULTISPECIES: DUF1501 domain-containing protein [unclassified Microbacterium]
MDGLSVLVPFEDPVLLAARPDIAIRGAQLLPVDQRFGLHPALGGLAPLLKAGKVAAVPDIATPELSRSHFQAQDCLERGGVSNGDSRGWLDRVLEASGAGTTFRSLSATNPLTRSLVGSSQSLVVRNLDSLTIDADGDTLDRTRRALELLYTGIDHPYAVQSSIALEAAAAAGQIPPSSAESTFPDGGFGDDLSMLSSIIRADLGMRVATIDLGGWDMHTGVGNVDAGDMTMMLAALGDGIAAFFDSLGDKAASTTMVVMSEFGRRVEQNGTGGTDHGHGGLALAIGGGVRGGVHGAWEALDAGMLERGDLPGRNDFRDLLSEVVAARLGLSASQMSGVFPGWKASPMGLMATG